MIFRRGSGQPTNLDSDADLYRGVARGLEAAMIVLYQRHGAIVYRFSLRLSQDPSIAEEVTQDVFLILMRQTDRYDETRSTLSTWLCGIARRLVWKQLERRKRSFLLDNFDDAVEIEAQEDDPAEALSRKQLIEAVQRGIEALPLPYREVLVLCELEEMSYEDAATVLEVPIGTVRSRMHRARAHLSKLLSGAAVHLATEKKL